MLNAFASEFVPSVATKNAVDAEAALDSQELMCMSLWIDQQVTMEAAEEEHLEEMLRWTAVGTSSR